MQTLHHWCQISWLIPLPLRASFLKGCFPSLHKPLLALFIVPIPPQASPWHTSSFHALSPTWATSTDSAQCSKPSAYSHVQSGHILGAAPEPSLPPRNSMTETLVAQRSAAHYKGDCYSPFLPLRDLEGYLAMGVRYMLGSGPRCEGRSRCLHLLLLLRLVPAGSHQCQCIPCASRRWYETFIGGIEPYLCGHCGLRVRISFG